MPLNIDDEGFESLELKNQENFKTLRNFFKNEIKNLNNEKLEIFNFSIEEIKKNINKKYGLLRQTLLMELFNIAKYSPLFEINLSEVNADLFYQDIHGRTIFHLACDDNKFFEYLLFHVNETPDNIKIICEISGNTKALKMIEFHRILNMCLNKDFESIIKVIENKKFDKEIFLKLLKKKKAILFK